MAAVKVPWLVFGFLWIFSGPLWAYNHDYMDVNCTNGSDHFTRELAASTYTYGFVRPVRHGGYPSGMDCSMTIRAPKDHYLVVKFQRLEIYQPVKNQCSDDYVTVAGNTSTYVYCGYRTPSHSLISTSDIIQVRFISTAVITDNTRSGFEIYYTAFHKGECHDSSDFPEEYRCRSGGRCIPSQLKCDHLDNCGDWSDERTKTCGMSQGLTICVSIMVVLVGGTCGVAIFMCICSKKKNARIREEGIVAQVEYTRGPNAVPTPQTGEKPPLPAYENYGYSMDYTSSPLAPSPDVFSQPPAYEDIAPAGHQALNDGAPAARSQGMPVQGAGSRVAPLPGSDGNQAAPLSGSEGNQVVPLPGSGGNQAAPLSGSGGNQAVPLSGSGSGGNQVAPLSGSG